DPAGKPLAGPPLMLDLVFRPGDEDNVSRQQGTEAGIAVRSSVLYGKDYGPGKGEGGRLTLPYLIPGAAYLIRAQEPLGWPVKKVFTAPEEGVLDLGDVVINPRVPAGSPRSP